MIGIQVIFRSGRFHGNGWHHAHNEGVPEWPPSPWRILRALVSAAYSLDIAPALLAPLLEKLRVLPRYRLPMAVDAHIRHYVPDTDDAKHKKAKIFDSFIAVDGGANNPKPLQVAWDVTLTADERHLLERLTAAITYVGRSESWADVQVVDTLEDQWDCWPSETDVGAATILVGCTGQDELVEWSNEATLQAKQKGSNVPRTLLDVLTFTGERYRDEGWSSVPGTVKARYVFRAAPFQRSVVPSRTPSVFVKPTAAHYAIRSAVLPRAEFGIAVAERLRQAIMKKSGDAQDGDASAVFSGHNTNNHAHAFCLPTTNSDGYISHLSIVLREIDESSGFNRQDVCALQQLRRLWGHGGHDLELVLIKLGRAENPMRVTQRNNEEAALRINHSAKVWTSHTPFVPTRHPKTVRGEQVDGIRDQIICACEQLVGQRPISVEPFGAPAKWARYRRQRKNGGGRKGVDMGVGARIEFAEVVTGPLAIGYGAHFGLGLFLPANVA